MSAGGKDRLGQRPLMDTLSPGTLTGLDYLELPRVNKVSDRKQPLFFIYFFLCLFSGLRCIDLWQTSFSRRLIDVPPPPEVNCLSLNFFLHALRFSWKLWIILIFFLLLSIRYLFYKLEISLQTN